MSVYFVTGRLGGGKTLIAVSKAMEYLRTGKPVATNLDLFFDKYPDNYISKKPNCIRIPDQPTAQDILDLGYGNKSPNEERNGLLIFDECGTWFNSHGWNDPDRKKFIDMLLHVRKRGWDVIFIVQHFDLVDKQARLSLCQFLVTCIRLDAVNIPILSFFTKLLTGKPFPMPRVHIGKVMYGYDSKALKADTWTYRGTELFDFYDTKQIFSPQYKHGNYSYLKPANFHYDKITKQKAKKDYQIRSLKRLWHIRPPVFFFFILGMFTMVAFGGLKALFDNSTKEELISTNLPGDYSPGKLTENKPDIIQSLSLKGITRINGNAVYFFFTKDGLPFDPSIDGYAYISRGDCGATLIRNDEIHHIDCSFDENIQEGDASRRVASST